MYGFDAAEIIIWPDSSCLWDWIIRIRSIYSTTMPNTNTLFGLLFGPNRIRREYSVQP